MLVRLLILVSCVGALSPQASAQQELVLPLNFPDWLPPAPTGRPAPPIEPGTKRVTEPAAYPPRREPQSARSITTPQGDAQTFYFDRNNLLIGMDYNSPYLGDPVGYRTALTRHFDENRQLVGISQVTVHRSGYSRTTHWDSLGKLTGTTVEDWLGRRNEYDPSGKWLQSTTTILPLAVQLREHPQVPLSDGIGAVNDPLRQSAQATSADFAGATTWSGVSVATLNPNGSVKIQHYNRDAFRTGASAVQPAQSEGAGSVLFKADHFTPNYQRAGRSDLTRSLGGERKAITYDPFGRPIARTVTTPAGSSFRYDLTGKLIGTSQ